MVDTDTNRFKDMSRLDLIARVEALEALINQPGIEEFLPSVQREAAHQLTRWGPVHDRNKTAPDWFWLVGYLAGKALAAELSGDKRKALHHTISTAAALFHWHTSIDVQHDPERYSDVEAILSKSFEAVI